MHLQELEKRYKGFRQFVQTAHDRVEGASLRKLAKRFSAQEQKRTEALSKAPEPVEGADSDFDALIAVAKRCVQDACGCLHWKHVARMLTQ